MSPPGGRLIGRMAAERDGDTEAIAIPAEVRDLLDAPNYVHLSTVRADGSPRSWVVWVGREGERLLICTHDSTWKAKDMRRDPRVALSVVDLANPYSMAAIQGRVADVRPDEDCRFMDPISIKYTSAPFPARGPGRVCFVIDVVSAGARRLDWLTHNPPPTSGAPSS
jgi:PPOX class probable F420-dependent enzyme